MRIDPKKILIVANTSVAGDRAIADWYATARGLGDSATDYHLLACDFGTSQAISWRELTYLCSASQRPGALIDEAAYKGQPFLTALRRMLTDGGIQALLVTPGVPKHDTHTATQETTFQTINGEQWATDPVFAYGGNQPTEGRMCQANRPNPYLNAHQSFLQLQYAGRRNAADFTGTPPYTPPPTRGFIDYLRDLPLAEISARYPRAYPQFTANKIVGWGRIGWPGCTLADVQRVVTDALWAEGQDNTGKQHIVGGGLYLGTTPPSSQYVAWKLFNDAGFSDLYHFDNATELAENPYAGTRKLNFANYAAGTVPTNAFATTLESSTGNTTALFQAGGAIYEATSFPRGAWGYWWTSFAYNFATMLLTKPGSGGVAAFTSVTEPYAPFLIQIKDASYTLLNGGSMLEAILEGAPANTTVWGDPLYRPYKAKHPSPPVTVIQQL